MKHELYVAPDGAEWWNGSFPEPDAQRMDGPMLGLRQAILTARQWRRNAQSDGPVTIWMKGGRYPLVFPLEFGPEDYGTLEFKAMPGEKPVLDGGVRVQDWEETTLNGRTVWSADVATILMEFGPFRSLFVNGARANRARYPREDYFWIEEAPDQPAVLNEGANNMELLRGSYRFRAAAGDLEPVSKWSGAEVIMLNRWINERMPVEAYDPATRLMKMATRTRLFLRTEFREKGKTIRYWIENVPEGLIEPGDWYLDAEARRVYYRPRRGEKPGTTEVVVPVVKQFVRIRGDLETLTPAGGLRFEGIGFEYADWSVPSNKSVWWDPYEPESKWRPRSSYRHFTEINNADPRVDSGSSPQAAFNLPGAISLEMARDVAFVDCRIAHVGFYGIGLGEGCRQVRMVGNEIADMGGGGILLDGTDPHGDQRRETGHCHITDNHIHGGGQVFLAACGITCVHTVQNTIAHNEIHDLTYSGISCGWMWGLTDSVSRLHWIRKNHIYDLGRRGGMSDMGGIYLLGPQPGTFVEGNYIHHVQSAAYGGWGIYPDEGSSLLTIEKNVVTDTGSHSLHEHMGRQNVIRNNFFLLGGEGGARFSRSVRNRWVVFPSEGGLFFRNIVVTDGEPVVSDVLTYQDRNPYAFDCNLYWDRRTKGAGFNALPKENFINRSHKFVKRSLASRRAAGQDRQSAVADPRFRDLAGGDFTLLRTSPALKRGIEPIDLSDVGPRAAGKGRGER